MNPALLFVVLNLFAVICLVASHSPQAKSRSSRLRKRLLNRSLFLSSGFPGSVTQSSTDLSHK